MKDPHQPKIADMPPWARAALEIKSRWMMSGISDDPPPTVVVEREGVPIVQVLVSSDDRKILHDTLAMIRAAAEPSAITLYTEAYAAASTIENDIRADPFFAGYFAGKASLTDLAKAGGIERGLILETVFALRWEREGPWGCASLAFRSEPGGIAWLEDESYLFPEPAEGRMMDLVRSAMGASPLASTPEYAEVRARTNLDGRDAEVILARAALGMLAHKPEITVVPVHPDFADLPDPSRERQAGEIDPKKALGWLKRRRQG